MVFHLRVGRLPEPFIGSAAKQGKNQISFFLLIWKDFILELENIDDENELFVGLVNWLRGKEFFCGSPRVWGMRLFNDISIFPLADDQVF